MNVLFIRTRHAYYYTAIARTKNIVTSPKPS